MNPMKTLAEPSSGRDLKSVLTSLRILGIALTLRSGLITLNTLIPLSFTLKRKKSMTLISIIH